MRKFEYDINQPATGGLENLTGLVTDDLGRFMDWEMVAEDILFGTLALRGRLSFEYLTERPTAELW